MLGVWRAWEGKGILHPSPAPLSFERQKVRTEEVHHGYSQDGFAQGQRLREAQAWSAGTAHPGRAAERAWGTGWRSLSAAPLCVLWQLAPAAREGLRAGGS